MASASSVLKSSLCSSLPTEPIHNGLVNGNFLINISCNSAVAGNGAYSLNVKRFKLNCSRDKEMDVSASALHGGIAESLTDMEIKEEIDGEGSQELSVSTTLMNFSNDFDPYGALSTPLYQTSTFKQPSATENGPYDYTRSGNPTRDVLERLMAKLEKADRAFCFTSGMAALASVTRLVGTGDEIIAGDDIYGGSDRLLSQVVQKSGVVVKLVSLSAGVKF